LFFILFVLINYNNANIMNNVNIFNANESFILAGKLIA
jgi:hypothetical protein